MKKYAVFALALLFIIGIVPGQETIKINKSITVTSPKTGQTFRPSQSLNIVWKGYAVSGGVRISIHKADNSDSRIVRTNLPVTGSTSIPLAQAPPGQYYVKVQLMDGSVEGTSGVFSVLHAPQDQRAEKWEYKITITRPTSSSGWKTGDTESINFETNFTPHWFRIDLYDYKEEKGTFDIHQGPLNPVGKNKFRVEWSIGNLGPNQSMTGWYKIRVEAISDRGEIVEFSPKFHISEGVKTTILKIAPDLILNGGQFINWSDNFKDTLKNFPGKARIGFCFTKPREDFWRCYLLASQIRFPLDAIREKQGLLLKADLVFILSSYSNAPSCVRNLYVLTAPWQGDTLHVPGYLYKPIPNNQNRDIRMDILQQVRDWLSGKEDNHGFLVTSLEKCQEQEKRCAFFFRPELQIEVLESGNQPLGKTR